MSCLLKYLNQHLESKVQAIRNTWVKSCYPIPYHLENTIRDASQLSFPCADSAYLGPGLGTLRHGSETVAGQGTQKIDSSIYFLELNLSLNVKKK